MVHGKWVKSTNEIKAVLLLGDSADDVTGINKSNERYEYLEGALQDLDVLVLHYAVDDGDVGLCIHSFYGSQGLLLTLATRTMFAPPGLVVGDVEGEQLALLRESSNFQVKANDKDIPSDPYSCPEGVQYDVSWSVLDGAEEAKNDDDDVEEVGKNRCPLVPQEVKDLPLQSGEQLQRAEEDERAAASAASHRPNKEEPGQACRSQGGTGYHAPGAGR